MQSFVFRWCPGGVPNRNGRFEGNKVATTKILKQTVESAAPKSVRYIIFDSVVPGFGLRVYPTGKMSWVFSYRPHPGGASTPKKTALIGTTHDFTPDAARKVADKMRSLVKTGGDPQASKAAQREAPTVNDVADAFLEQHVRAKRASNTADSYEDLLIRFVRPRLGAKKAKDVTGRDISAIHADIGNDRVLRDGTEVEGRPYQANRVLAVVSAMYGWAGGPVAMVPKGVNPAKGIERFSEEQRGRVLSPDELGRLGNAIRLAETEGLAWTIRPDGQLKHLRKTDRKTVIGEHAAAALRLLILTGARLREILGMRWDQVDLERGLLMLPKHKSSRLMGIKTIVLNAPALEVLASLPRAGIYIIAGDSAGQPDEKPRADLKRPWAVVRKAAGLGDLRIHDLRHNFGGFGAGGGAGLLIIGKLLGHSPQNPETTARYSHLDNDPLRRATNTIGSALSAAMGDNAKDKSKNNVILLADKKAS